MITKKIMFIIIQYVFNGFLFNQLKYTVFRIFLNKVMFELYENQIEFS